MLTKQVIILRSLMSKLKNPAHLAVIWETVPEPDKHAMLKAVALMLNRRLPISTAADLTTCDKTLMCRRPPDP